ncbi:vacuolar protein sorting-associated protein 54-like protein [Dermatophagoides farinae]|uniref:Vacuolar protein sorting-associated protein 54 n=1 Tax=Dermatophagoides farinae TaxID=6954 RepID=A0A9D4SIK9_DERFA|nr:vacuolar protein sorting-associated protein 54-like protein [Dermatophagoides farinae]
MNTTSTKHWKRCEFCTNDETFSSPFQFGNHLRMYHSKIEGGSHVCSYGPNSMCPLLPYEGVSGRDYETHVAKCHIFPTGTTITATTSDPQHFKHQQRSSEQQQRQEINNGRTSQSNNRFDNRNCDFPRPSTLNTTIVTNDEHNTNDRPNVIDNVNWSIFSASQDLTSILNDPHKPRSYYDNLFTKDWGANFVDTGYVAPFVIAKKPARLLFDSYMKKIQKRKHNLPTTNHRSSPQQQQQQLPSSQNPFDHSLDKDSMSDRLVPRLFFDPDFNLDKSETFIGLIRLFADGGGGGSSGQQLDGTTTTDQLSLESLFHSKSMNEIQKSLSEYLDIVEQDLSHQIGHRSQDFFQVMSSMDLIMERLKDSIRQVTQIRQVCRQLNDSLIQPIQTINELNQLRTKYRDVFRKINWIATVHQTQPTIQLLLSKSDYAGALDLISTSEEVVAQELNGVISLRYLRLQLMEIEKVIEQMLNEEFVKYLTAEWNRPVSSSDDNDNDNEDGSNNVQKEKLLSIIYGMLKLQRFNFIDTFREEAFTAIKTSVKQTVIETLSSEDNIEVARIDTSLFEQLKCLCFDKWISCLVIMFDRLVILLRRVRHVYDVINDGFATMTYSSSNAHHFATNNSNDIDGGDAKVILPIDYYDLSSRLKEILHSICDFAHGRTANIIELRANDGSLDRFDSGQFMQLTNSIESFIADCELVCGRRSPNLKLVIQIQSNKFVSKFHDERKRKLRQLLDLEQWKAVNNISPQIQQLYHRLVIDIDEYGDLLQVYADFKNSKFNQDDSSANCSSYITLNGERFVIINTVINLVYMIIDYCQLGQQFGSSLSPDVFMRLIDLLKLFNSRTSQLILGAEALQVTGLKTITARTLIISMRSLIFILRCIPRIRHHFGPLLTHKTTMLKHLDELNELYANHLDKIPEKIIGLVRDVVHAHIINKWVAKAPIPSVPFQTISQHLSRLHDNIQDILPYDDLQQFFQKIHALIIHTFREQLLRLKINNDGGPQHGLVTQELTFYTQNMKNLSIGKDLDLSYNDLWSS